MPRGCLEERLVCRVSTQRVGSCDLLPFLQLPVTWLGKVGSETAVGPVPLVRWWVSQNLSDSQPVFLTAIFCGLPASTMDLCGTE